MSAIPAPLRARSGAHAKGHGLTVCDTGNSSVVEDAAVQPWASSSIGHHRSGSRDVGATGVFDAELDGQMLTFRVSADGFADDQTGSVWNVLGQAVSGPLAGKSLTPIVHGNHFWFAWAAFAPETVVYRGGE